jgi:Sec-independent protein secretion pathway component TatC
MEYGKMLGDSIEYAKDAVWGKWVRWILLVISTIIFPLILGYMMEVYRGKKPAPEMEHWGKLFVDGLKLFVAGLIYAIPVIIILIVFIGGSIISVMPLLQGNPDMMVTNPEAFMGALAGILIGIIIAIIVGFIIGLISTIGMVRLARTDRFGEAFNFSAILTTIRTIGWGTYIVALIVLFIVAFIFALILNIIMAIPFIGWLIYLFLLPLLILFEARFITQVYESGEVPVKQI